ncbi:Golgin subfamily A member 5 [Elysia marginata]|uniref:Golgin subfamily A member 5 n=1 Tax=Elysia marginata TaxID=1093978 RepID=A0AAV4E8K3_9GAST|nr:Golgin subfamily A member 5 [Elysia marginata]
MSWFSAMTGKAEDFLNRLDKTAADALHADDVIDKPPPPPEPTLIESTVVNVENKPLSPSQSVPARLHHLSGETDPSSSLTSAPVRSLSRGPSKAAPAVPPSKKKNSDDALFDFLNSKDNTEGNKRLRTPVSSRHHSRQSSTSSVVSSTSKGAKSEGGIIMTPVGDASQTSDRPVTPSSGMFQKNTAPSLQAPPPDTGNGDERQDSPTNSHLSADVDVLADAMKESPVGSDQSAPDSDQAEASEQKERQLSSLELENRLLRNEVASLNEEMAGLISRSKDSETEASKLRSKLASQANSASMHDQLVRELQARELDLTEALKAKDAQLAVLRVRLDEADRRVVSREKNLEEVKLERERILQDHSHSSGVHGQALDSMKEKLEQTEAALYREQEAYRLAQQEANERQAKLEREQQSLAEALTAAEKRVAQEKAKLSDLVGQRKAAEAAASAAKKELTDYKEKASRILQSKEKLISSLRDGGMPMSEGGVSNLEHEAMRQERDMVREELQQARLTIENLRVELQDVENQLQQESDTSQETIASLEASLEEEKRRRDDAEQELLKQQQEYSFSVEELSKQKSTFQSRINHREAEIEKLRNQLMTKSMSSSTEHELESRVRALTESLIQKQTVLEALGTEKNSLVLQLERMECQIRDLESAAPRAPSASQFVAVNDHDDDAKQRLPMFLREVPSDHEVTRRMKRAANSIDGFSIRLGVFLRRYPMARVFVIVYMGLLHLWVLVVMMTYQPEIHSADSQPQPPSDN